MPASGITSDMPPWIDDARSRLVAVSTQRPLTSGDIRKLGFAADLSDDVRIEAAYLYLGTDVRIGTGTRIECERLFLGDMATVGEGVRVATRELLLADGSYLGDRVTVDLAGGRHADSALLVGPASVIGADVLVNTCREVLLDVESALSPRCMVFTHSYWQSTLDGYSAGFRPVRIGPNAAVGAGTALMPGAVVGSGAVVMANSTVLAEVAADTLVGGVPAAVLRREIRRPLEGARRRRLVRRIVEELLATLRDRGCAVTTTGESAFSVFTSGGPPITLRIAESEDTGPAREGEIVLALEGPYGSGGGGTVFDFSAGVVSGPETPLAFEVRNLLRRFGIRFQPYAWRADYRRGF